MKLYERYCMQGNLMYIGLGYCTWGAQACACQGYSDSNSDQDIALTPLTNRRPRNYRIMLNGVRFFREVL